MCQGDHLYGKPGNFRDFDSCQGNVRYFSKTQGNGRGKILSGKSGEKLYIVSCIFASVWVFSSIQLVLYVNYAFIIMKCLCRILIIDSNTCTGVITVSLNLGRSATNCQWISQCLESNHSVPWCLICNLWVIFDDRVTSQIWWAWQAGVLTESCTSATMSTQILL